MAKLTKIIRSKDPVSETEANVVFDLLIPILETDPSVSDVLDTAADVIKRCALSEDRPLAYVLDWWYMATTGRPSANSGAHRLPDSLNGLVKKHMEAVVNLGVSLPAATWLDKRQEFRLKLEELDEKLQLDSYGTVKLSGEVWPSFSEPMGETVKRLKGNQRASRVEIDSKKLEQELRDRGIEAGRYKQLLRSCRKDTDFVNRIVDLQVEVEAWKPRVAPELLKELPSDFKAAVGPLADALLRPILRANVAPSVDRAVVADLIDSASRSGDKSGRYRLARLVDSWCERTGESVGSLEEEVSRHRKIKTALKNLEARASVEEDSIDEIRLHVLDDNFDEAETVLERVQEQIRRAESAELVRSQLGALQRRLSESSLSDDVAWQERVRSISARLEVADTHETAREIDAAQKELVTDLNQRLQEELEDLRQLLDSLRDLDVGDLTIPEWEQRIDDIQSRGVGGAGDLRQEIEAEIQKFREERRDAVEKILRQVNAVLTDEREEFSGENIGDFEHQRSVIAVQLKDLELTDSQLVETHNSATNLWSDLEERRIHRWRFDQGEGRLVDHLVNYCRGALDFDEMDIRRLYVSLKTRPFVILAGLTGSGKSSLTRTFAAAFGADGSNGRFRRIAVRPDWIDQTDVLGYVNPISEQFVPGWLAETIQDCESEPNRLHFVLLDEMNLAPVEQYLAEWLSAIEEERSGSEHVKLPLYSSALTPKNSEDWPHTLDFPDNLIIVGTVNVDETTRPLSERVLDRANVLLLNVEVSGRHHEPNGQHPAAWHVGVAEWRRVCATAPSDKHHPFLVDVADILRHASIGVGLRAHLELERFVANAEGVIDDVVALDWGLVQRIIPKIRGFKGHLSESLTELLEEFVNVGAEQAASIVRRWLDDSVSDDEFLEGTDPRIALARV